jgi:hypothetical protein
VRRAIEQADVIVVWSEVTPLPAWAAFELGFATALDKPTLALSATERAQTPLTFLTAPTVDPEDVQAVAALLDSALHPKDESAPVRHPTELRPSSDVSVGRVEDAIASGPAAVINLIEDTLIKTGARPVRRNRGSPKLTSELPKVDLAVWIDEFEGTLGNPVVIDIKRRLTAKSIPVTSRQIQRYLSLTGASVGLIVYIDASESMDSFELFRYAGRRIQWISVRTLFDEWRSKSFSDLIQARVLTST